MNTTNEIAAAETASQEIFSQEEINEVTEKGPDGQEAMLHSDPKKARMLKALIKVLGIVSYACQEAGIPRRTHYNWMKTDEEYKAAVESLIDATLDFSEVRLFKEIQKSDLKAIMFILRTRGKDRGYTFYNEREAARQAAVYNFIIKNKEAAEMIQQTKEIL
ncbi:MAG: hypothetical protein ACLQQ4_03380 [Bacteroidia bacterium]